MPASPIVKEMDALPDHWVHLQKTMIPDDNTGCYWSVWYDPPTNMKKGTAWLMWCAIGDDPSVNDNWCHAEEINEECRNILYAIESVYGVSFHDSIWVEMGAGETFPAKNKEEEDAVFIEEQRRAQTYIDDELGIFKQEERITSE